MLGQENIYHFMYARFSTDLLWYTLCQVGYKILCLHLLNTDNGMAGLIFLVVELI